MESFSCKKSLFKSVTLTCHFYPSLTPLPIYTIFPTRPAKTLTPSVRGIGCTDSSCRRRCNEATPSLFAVVTDRPGGRVSAHSEIPVEVGGVLQHLQREKFFKIVNSLPLLLIIIIINTLSQSSSSSSSTTHNHIIIINTEA